MPSDPSDAPPPEDAVNRRSGNRHLSCIPASMLRDKPGIALVRNISVHGALILTRSKLAVGDDLHLNLHLTDDGPGVPVRASVVRVIARLAKREVWKYEVGVEFAAPITEYAEQVRELEAKQTRLGFAKL